MNESKEELEQLKKDLLKEKQRYLMVAMEREEQLQKQVAELDQKREELDKLQQEQAAAAPSPTMSQDAQAVSTANQELLDQQKKLISQQHGILTLLNGVLNSLIQKDREAVIQAMQGYGMNEQQIQKLEKYIMSHKSTKRREAAKAK